MALGGLLSVSFRTFVKVLCEYEDVNSRRTPIHISFLAVLIGHSLKKL
jgi:hypothetical protein